MFLQIVWKKNDSFQQSLIKIFKLKERYATGMKTWGVARLCNLHVLYEIANFRKFYFISVLFQIFVKFYLW